MNMSNHRSTALLVLLLIIITRLISAIETCYAPGPVFPPLHPTVDQSLFGPIRKKLDAVVKDILESQSDQEGWSSSTTSFGVQLTSAKDTIWSSYHTASVLGEYKDSKPSNVTGDTAFRIGSISKTFTVYALLLEKRISLEDPITKYIPELNDGENKPWSVRWDEITIRSLASQLSGISRETALLDLAADRNKLPHPLADGFPSRASIVEELAPCGKNFTDRACTRSEIIDVARIRSRVFNPNDRSTYSNIAFTLLGLALQNVTGQPYSSIISSSITIPLHMYHTTLTKPPDSAGIIPVGRNDWTWDSGVDAPTGGIYSTPNDLTFYLRSILAATLLPRSTIAAWLKPHSWTNSGTSSFYGMPWEIYRPSARSPAHHPTTYIIKGGSLTQYFSTIALLPAHGLGLSLLVAGAYPALLELIEKVTAAVVPAVEELLREEVRRRYEGTYVDRGEDGWGLWGGEGRVRLEVPDDGRGLVVREWTSNGTEFLGVYGRLKGMDGSWEARLVPSGVAWEEEGLEMEVWRVVAVPVVGEEVRVDEEKVWDAFCMTDMDALMYGGRSVEEVIFGKKKEGGEVMWMAISGLRMVLFKAERGVGHKGAQNVLGETEKGWVGEWMESW